MVKWIPLVVATFVLLSLSLNVNAVIVREYEKKEINPKKIVDIQFQFWYNIKNE